MKEISKEREKLKDRLDRMNYAYLNKEVIFNWNYYYEEIRKFILNIPTLSSEEHQKAKQSVIEANIRMLKIVQPKLDIKETPQFLQAKSIMEMYMLILEQALNDKDREIELLNDILEIHHIVKPHHLDKISGDEKE